MKKIYYVLFLILLSSCFSGRSQPSNFYVLRAIPEENITYNVKNSFIGIDVLYIASYLDRKEIITTVDGNNTEIQMSEFNRWAEPLSSAIQRNIVLNMSTYMPNSLIRSINAFNRNFDYIVLVYINRFDGSFNDKVYLDAFYSIVDKKGKIIASDKVLLTNNLSDTYDDLAIQESGLISKLSQILAKKISQIDSK